MKFNYIDKADYFIGNHFCKECKANVKVGQTGFPVSKRAKKAYNYSEYALFQIIKYQLCENLCDMCYRELGGG